MLLHGRLTDGWLVQGPFGPIQAHKEPIWGPARAQIGLRFQVRAQIPRPGPRLGPRGTSMYRFGNHLCNLGRHGSMLICVTNLQLDSTCPDTDLSKEDGMIKKSQTMKTYLHLFRHLKFRLFPSYWDHS